MQLNSPRTQTNKSLIGWKSGLGMRYSDRHKRLMLCNPSARVSIITLLEVTIHPHPTSPTLSQFWNVFKISVPSITFSNDLSTEPVEGNSLDGQRYDWMWDRTHRYESASLNYYSCIWLEQDCTEDFTNKTRLHIRSLIVFEEWSRNRSLYAHESSSPDKGSKSRTSYMRHDTALRNFLQKSQMCVRSHDFRNDLQMKQ